MTTISLIVDIAGKVSFSMMDDGTWRALGDPHQLLRGNLNGKHKFEPPDATAVYSATSADIFKLVGFRFAAVKKSASSDALNWQGSAGSWTVTDVFS